MVLSDRFDHAIDRRGPDRDRSVRRGAGAALERRSAGRRRFRVFRNARTRTSTSKREQEDLTELVEVDDDEAVHPPPRRVRARLDARAGARCPTTSSARLEGKSSSLGRLGLLIHSTAGYIDPGWDGHVTLELSNVANLPITIYPEMKIGQISFLQMTDAAETPYGSGAAGSKYQGQRGPTPSRY